jgi:hypothetical protein
VADKPGQTQSFYRWQDAQGRVHIVSSLDEVPLAERAKLGRVDLNGADAVSHYPSDTPGTALPKIDWPSAAIGFGAALLVAMVFRFVPNGWRWLGRLALVGGIGLLLTGAYLAAVRRSAGFEGGALASPSALIQDAKTAVEQMNQRQKQQDEELRKIQAEGH